MADRLTRAHIIAQARLRGATEAQVRRIWSSLPGYASDADLERWLASVVPVIDAAQRASATTAEAFIARARGRTAPGLDKDQIIAATRNGATNGEVYARPIITVRTALSEGRPWEQAVAAGLARATATAAMDVQMTMRATAQAAQDAGLAEFGYQRVADATACEFCLMIDGAYVKSADAMALHNNCGCGLEPLDAPHPRAAKVPSGVAVHNHGELGPVLGSPDHDFQTL